MRRFGSDTQQAPIGLAGGLNLYGFASGDPVNFSDPFGLCPEVPVLCPALAAAGPLVGAAIGATLLTVAQYQLDLALHGNSQPLIPTSGARPTAEEDRAVQDAGAAGGCMTCGATEPGTATGRWIRNHVPPTSVRIPGEPSYLGPHCQDCSNRQGGWLRQMLRRLHESIKKGGGDDGPSAQTPSIALADFSHRINSATTTQGRTATMNWVVSGGGPLLLMEESRLTEWRGADAPFGHSDYERACAVKELGTVKVGNGQALVVSGEPLETSWWPIPSTPDALIVQWVFADSDAAVAVGLTGAAAALLKPIGVTVRFDSPNLRLFDSAMPGDEIPTPSLSVKLHPGTYAVGSGTIAPNERTQLRVHRLSRTG